MNLIEGGRPRIGCIRRQPSAGRLILSLEEGRPSMGKIAGASRKKGSGEKDHFREANDESREFARRKHRNPGPLREELSPERTTDLPRANERRMSKL